MDLDHQLDQYIENIFPQIVSWRRYLHEHPELSFQEEETSAWLYEQLIAMGCQVTKCTGNHGLIVTIMGALEGPTIALRADIDGLPIQDEKDVPYASKVPGVMHACGHDGHSATLLAIAQFYQEHQAKLKGERRLLFQPAEEVAPGGAAAMIAEGALEDVDVIYGVHLWSPLPTGHITTRAGHFMSAVDDFTIEIKGCGGHGGMPHDAIDTVIVGSALVQAIQTIVSRNVNPVHPAVVTIGSFQAGTANNIIADRCLLKGTIRSFDERTRTEIQQRLREVIKHVCMMHGAEHSLDLRSGYPSVVNDADEADAVMELTARLFGEQQVSVADPIMIAEDFSYYLQHKPGCFMFVGARHPDHQEIVAHHHPKFDIDEAAMKHAMKLLIHLAEQYTQR